MKLARLSLPLRRWPAWITVLLLGALAAATPWLDSLRPAPPDLQADREIRVTTPLDAGPGSLREAIFAADRAGGRARIVLEVPAIVLETPLPPLINPEGVVIDGGTIGCDIDARALRGGPALELASPRSMVDGLRIRGAAGVGFLLRGKGARLRRVAVRDSAVGVYLTEEADDLLIEEAEFEGNAVGVHLSPSMTQANLKDNLFRKHKRAAVWAVARQLSPGSRPAAVNLRGNRFEADSIGVVLINVSGRIERNQFSGAQTAAVYLAGPGAVVRENRISAGAGFGIYADATEGTPIEENEVDHNSAGGVLVRGARNTTVRSNRIYANGYGIVVVFGSTVSPNTVASNVLLGQLEDGLYVVGGSPLMRANQVRGSRGSGLRILDFLRGQRPRVVAEPFLEGNILTGNGSDVPSREEYRIDD